MTQAEELAERLTWAKQCEADARATRIILEEQLVALIGAPPDGASETSHHGRYRLRVQAPVHYSVDAEAWCAVAHQIPEALWPVKLAPVADKRAIGVLRREHPDLWTLAAAAITSKPGKVSITVENTDDGR